MTEENQNTLSTSPVEEIGDEQTLPIPEGVDGEQVEKQNQIIKPVADIKIPTGENLADTEVVVSEPVLTELKQEVVEPVPVVEETSIPPETTPEEQNTTSQVKQIETEVVEPIIEPTTETPIIETVETIEKTENEEVESLHSIHEDEVIEEIQDVEDTHKDAGLLRSEDFAEATEEEQNDTTGLPSRRVSHTPASLQGERHPLDNFPVKTTEEIGQTPPNPNFKKVDSEQANFIQSLLGKARAKIQGRKREKLNKIMLLFESNLNISNSDVQKLLRTTKRSATRYLDILEKEQKIIQVGVTGRSVRYVRK